MFLNFHRTIANVFKPVWKRILEDHEDELQDMAQRTVDQFVTMIRLFIKEHATEEDQHELARQIRTVKKPPDMLTHSFWYRMLEMNGYLPHLPGEQTVLPQEELKQAFFDAMPEAWKARFKSAGKSMSMPTAELIHYFRVQEQLTKTLERNKTESHKSEHQKQGKKPA